MRVEHIGDATLYLGDCLEILPTLGCSSLCAKGEPCMVTDDGRCDAQKIDAVITDPPYGIGYSGMRGKFAGSMIASDDSTHARDRALDLIDAPKLVFGSWKVARPAGLKQILTWEKGDHVGMGDLSIPWRQNTEEIYVIGDGFVGHRVSAVLRVNAPPPNFTPDAKRFHPTEKPVRLIAMLAEKCPQGTIADPFMGSGTTGVACAQLGRKFIGIEIEPKYFDIACRRIEDAYRQRPLFEPAPVDAYEQVELDYARAER